MRRPRMPVVAAALSALTAAGGAHAQSADEHATATSLVHQLEQDPSHRPITTAALERAKEALERATRLRGAGDEAHAKAADGLAREWAETARDLARAADAELAAADSRRKAVDAQARQERARALVAEGIARVGRLRAQLDEAGRAAPRERTAVEMHDGDRSTKAPDSKSQPEKHSPPREAP